MSIKNDFINFFGEFKLIETKSRDFFVTEKSNGLYLMSTPENGKLINPFLFNTLEECEDIYICDERLESITKKRYESYEEVDLLTFYNFDDDMRLKHSRIEFLEMLNIHVGDDFKEKIAKICKIIIIQNNVKNDLKDVGLGEDSIIKF